MCGTPKSNAPKLNGHETPSFICISGSCNIFRKSLSLLKSLRIRRAYSIENCECRKI